MDIILGPLLSLLLVVIQLYVWVLVAAVIFSWLYAFNVVNQSNRFVYMIADFTHRLTEPALKPIRKFLPNMGGFDISPIILILVLMFFENMVIRLLNRIG